MFPENVFHALQALMDLNVPKSVSVQVMERRYAYIPLDSVFAIQIGKILFIFGSQIVR